jgi:hypothetical protein
VEKSRSNKYNIVVSRGKRKNVPLTCACDRVDKQLLSVRQAGGVGENLCLMKRPKSPCVLCCPAEGALMMLMDESV